MKKIDKIIIMVAISVMIIYILASPKQPQVVVNWPKDGKPLETMVTKDTIVINNDKAILWWTVFKATLDKNHAIYSAVGAANSAVNAVYQNENK